MLRCADAARLRADPPPATAPAAARLLMIEVAGAWGRSALSGGWLDPTLADRLTRKTERAGVRVQLIRRPGRDVDHGELESARAWGIFEAVADGPGILQWGSWRRPCELMEIDLAARLDRPAAIASGPQRVALICTHGRHDACCALRGRPVAAAMQLADGWDAWETSHTGGDRFAANLLLLPHGELFGSLDVETATAAAEWLDRGRLSLAHHRGRVGLSAAEQAARYHAAVHLDDDRIDAFSVVTLSHDKSGCWRAVVEQCGGPRYRLTLAEAWLAPALLTCSAVEAAASRRFDLLEWNES